MSIADNYRTVVFLDSNVVLEAKELAELPWNEIDPIGPILLLATPTLLREVDSKKRDGRLATRARSFNRTLVPLTRGGEVVPVVRDGLIVDLGVARCGRIDWDLLDELDPDQGDDRIIAEITASKLPTCQSRVFVSQDLRPLLSAARYGIETFHLGSHWLPKPDPSPHEREIARLKQRVREYESAEPKFDVGFELDAVQPVNLVSVRSLTECERLDRLAKAVEHNPCDVQADDNFGLSYLNYDSSLQSRYEEYVAVTLPEFFASYESRLETLFNQRLITLTLRNVGNTQAEKVRVEVRVVGGWVNSKPIMVPVHGPASPRARSRFHMPVFNGRLMNERVGRHEFDLEDVDRQESFVAECEDFRQGSQWTFQGALVLDASYRREPLVIVTITASNRMGEVTELFPISRVVESVAAEQLVSVEGGYARDPAVLEFFKQAVDREDFAAFDIDSVKDD